MSGWGGGCSCAPVFPPSSWSSPTPLARGDQPKRPTLFSPLLTHPPPLLPPSTPPIYPARFSQVPYCTATGDNPNCGDKVLPPLFFIACHFLTFFIAIKLFLVVVSDAYNVAMTDEATRKGIFKLTRDVAGDFRRKWVTLDAAATSFLRPADLEELVLRIEAPLGLKTGAGAPSVERRAEARALVRGLALVPDARGLCHFHAVLHALVARASSGTTAGAPLGSVAVWGVGLEPGWKAVGFTLAELRKVVAIQAAFRGYKIRKGIREARSVAAGSAAWGWRGGRKGMTVGGVLIAGKVGGAVPPPPPPAAAAAAAAPAGTRKA